MRKREREREKGIGSAGGIGQLQLDPEGNECYEDVVIYDLTVGTSRGKRNRKWRGKRTINARGWSRRTAERKREREMFQTELRCEQDSGSARAKYYFTRFVLSFFVCTYQKRWQLKEIRIKILN